MLGGMLAGHSESSGEIIEKNGKKYKLFYGMSSDTAMRKHAGGVADYRWDSVKKKTGFFVAEKLGKKGKDHIPNSNVSARLFNQDYTIIPTY